MSRIAPSTITPPRPVFAGAEHQRTHQAAVWSPLPSMTRISPAGQAMAAWIIRVVSGRTSTVKAGPASFYILDARRHACVCMVPRRLAIAGLVMAAWKLDALLDDLGAGALRVTDDFREVGS